VASRRKCTARSIGAAMCAISSVTNYRITFIRRARLQKTVSSCRAVQHVNNKRRSAECLVFSDFWHQISSSLPKQAPAQPARAGNHGKIYRLHDDTRPSLPAEFWSTSIARQCRCPQPSAVEPTKSSHCRKYNAPSPIEDTCTVEKSETGMNTRDGLRRAR
jgi:hypothetical protein